MKSKNAGFASCVASLTPVAVLGALVLAAPAARAAPTDVSVGVAVSSDGVEGFQLAVCDHYHVKRETVAVIRARKIPDDHVPVVFFIAERAHCTPEAVLELRLGGKSWMDIGLHFGLSAEIFHVDVHGDYGPPYGRALGHFKNRKRSEWGAIRLADDDVACLVNIQFLSSHHGCSPDDVLKLHVKGESLFSLHGKLKAKGGGGKAGGNAKAGGGSPGKGGAPDKAAGGASGKPDDRGATAQKASGGGGKSGGDVGAYATSSGKGKGASRGGAKGGGGKGGGRK